MDSKTSTRRVFDAVLMTLTAVIVLWALIVAVRNSGAENAAVIPGVTSDAPKPESDEVVDEGEKLVIKTASSDGSVTDRGNIEWNVYIPFEDPKGGPQLNGSPEIYLYDSLDTWNAAPETLDEDELPPAPHSFDEEAEHSVILYGYDYEGKRFDYAEDPKHAFRGAEPPLYEWSPDGKNLVILVKEPRGGWKKWCDEVNKNNKPDEPSACQLRFNYQTKPDEAAEPRNRTPFIHTVTNGIEEIPSDTVYYESPKQESSTSSTSQEASSTTRPSS